jgi:putative transposase
MRKSKFSGAQIAAILKETEAGVAVTEVARKHGISAATFYQWRSKYGGMDVSVLQRMREQEQENARLKRLYADLSLDRSILKGRNTVVDARYLSYRALDGAAHQKRLLTLPCATESFRQTERLAK